MSESTTAPLTGPPRFFRPDGTDKANPGTTARKTLHKNLVHALDRVVRHVNRLGLEDQELMLAEWAPIYVKLSYRLHIAATAFEQQLAREVGIPIKYVLGWPEGVTSACAALSPAAREMLNTGNPPDWTPTGTSGAER